MDFSRRRVLGALAAGAAMGPRAVLAEDELDYGTLLYGLVNPDPAIYTATLDLLEGWGGTEFASSIIFSFRYGYVPRGRLDVTLEKLTGAEHSGWFEWMLWQENNPQVTSHPAFYDFKRTILLQIDPNFDDFLNPGFITPNVARIRFEEVTWGGVRKDGIPSLDNPDLTSASDAEYLLEDDLVFGVSINGDARAYPLRVMGWHEMFNEVIGGVPVALAYCTLCGAGILFETQLENRSEPLVFGSSGFLFRSNKLMFDRATHTLWNQFTGRPVMGELVESGIELEQRPVVITEWANWRRDNPDTKVLSVRTGHKRDYGSGVVYRDYFASDDLMFPAFLSDEALQQKDYVFGVRLAGGAKAWALKAFKGGRVINDEVGFHNLVLIGDEATRTVRAYDRGDLSFAPDLTADGTKWTVTEDALVAEDGRKAPRVPGHVAYWFAWAGYLGDSSEFYEG